jgi:hypothetical protein
MDEGQLGGCQLAKSGVITTLRFCFAFFVSMSDMEIFQHSSVTLLLSR